MTPVKSIAMALMLSILPIFPPFATIKHPFLARAPSLELTPPAFCSAPEYRQFDFWLGDWDAFDQDNLSSAVARIKVERILDGCVLREDYQGAGGLKGQSFTLYDASRGSWHQSWVTNRGQLLIIEGAFDGAQMVLSGSEHTSTGEKLVRGTWKQANAGVRENAMTSTDGGKSWKPWFDLQFRPHKR
jgi:hypothetical protein